MPLHLRLQRDRWINSGEVKGLKYLAIQAPLHGKLVPKAARLQRPETGSEEDFSLFVAELRVSDAEEQRRTH